MMQPQQGVSLKAYNTLGIDVKAAFFTQICHLDQLQAAQKFCLAQGCPWLLIGGGSNLVLTEDFAGLVMVMAMEQIDWPTTAANEAFVVTAQAGCEWDALVAASIERGASGLENLSLIPGQVGAAPIQNIGAYGVEVKQYLRQVQVFNFASGELFEMTAQACELGYRDSIFKYHKHWIVTQVTLQLRRDHQPQLQYGIIAETIIEMTGKPALEATVQQVRDAVISIRQTKLPDPKSIPNVGSFFKNPIVSAAQAAHIRQAWPDLVAYQVDDLSYKLAAGWLIDQLGWKGYSQAGVGVHKLQALVLVATGKHVSGAQVLSLARRIQADVQLQFGVGLEVEPRLFDSRGECYL